MYLKVFEDVKIPTDYAATQKYAVLAKSNGGKTYLTLKFEEQMCDAGMFFVTLDPVGKHWALRAGQDGNEEGGKSDVWVLGGLHGDVPLEPGSGSLIADTVIEHPGRYVLDVSAFETDAEQDRFALDFAKRLFRRKAKDPGFPLLLLLEEAESFIPQVAKPGQQQMLGAFARIARQGRNHGIGLWMVAQRSAALNKGVLSQADVLIAKQMSHKRDRDSVDEWVKSNGTPEERETLMASLASLSVEEAWVWSPAWLGCFERTKILPRVTFDSSANVAHGQQATSVSLTPLDVEELGREIAATAERAKADDPKELRRRIAELEADLHRDQGALEDLAAAEEAAQELEQQLQELRAQPPRVIEVVPAGVREALETLAMAIEDRGRGLVDNAQALRDLIDGLPDEPKEVEVAAATVPAPSRPREAPSRETVTTPPPAPARHSSSNGQLPKAAEELAKVLATFPQGLTREQLALFTGRKPRGGSWNTAMRVIFDDGYAEERGGFLLPTSKLREMYPDARPPNRQEYVELWLAKLSLPAREIFNYLLSAGGGEKTYEEIAQAIDRQPRGGSWNTAIKELRTAGIAEGGRGTLMLKPELVPPYVAAS